MICGGQKCDHGSHAPLLMHIRDIVATDEIVVIDRGHIARSKLAAPRLSHSAIAVKNLIVVAGGRRVEVPALGGEGEFCAVYACCLCVCV